MTFGSFTQISSCAAVEAECFSLNIASPVGGRRRPLPDYAEREGEAYLKCSRQEEGFLRVCCDECHAEKLMAFSCKKRGLCPSCGARRMAETAALMTDEVLRERPLRQWLLSVPHALRLLPPTSPAALTQVLGVVYRVISCDLLRRAGLTLSGGHTGAVTMVQRVGSALSLNVHFRSCSRCRPCRPEAG